MNHQNLWAPWRSAYLKDLARQAEASDWDAASPGGFLASYFDHPEDDEANFVIHRDANGIILLNRYPYSNGHLLVALGEARPTLHDYDPAQRAAFWNLVEFGWALMRRALAPQGINLGINEGRAAGAGVPDHLHAHLVPRWGGDTNFITVAGNVRVVPTALEDTAARYRQTRATLCAEG